MRTAMAAKNYAHVVDGVVDNIIVLDPDQTDPTEFATLIGGSLVDLDGREERWEIGAKWDGKKLTEVEQPPAPEPDPNAPPPPPSVEDRLAALQTQVDDLTTMILEV